tara:strand:- start:362 stop:955 length:594 start_codon:yes stop_codon:yes gene_type:complete
MISLKKYVAIVLLVSSVSTFAQDKTKIWAAGIGGSFFITDDRVAFPKDGFNVQIPNLSLTRYMGKGFSASVKVSFTGISGIDGFFTNDHYITFMDLHGKYDFHFTENKLVPYVVGGIGLNVKDKIDRATSLNVGAGLTYWLFPSIGLNGEIVYRAVSSSDPTAFSSIPQFSASLLFTFGESTGRRNRRRTGHGFTTK